VSRGGSNQVRVAATVEVESAVKYTVVEEDEDMVVSWK